MYNTRISQYKYQELIREVIRYLIVGGSAFFVDTIILYLTKTYLFYGFGRNGILFATSAGFTAGLIYNYILSIVFVFKSAEDKVKGGQLKSFIIFTVIGIIGLLLTELGMYVGTSLVSIKYYLIIKAFVAGVVLVWNYVARKILIFN